MRGVYTNASISSLIKPSTLFPNQTSCHTQLHRAWLTKRSHLKALYLQSNETASPAQQQQQFDVGRIAYLKALAREQQRTADHQRSNDVLDAADMVTPPPAPIPSSVSTATAAAAAEVTVEEAVSTTPSSNVTRPRHKAPTPMALRKMKNPYWGGWEKWSACSRSCGGGVTTQTRNCYVR